MLGAMIRRFAPAAFLFAIALLAAGCGKDPARSWRGMNVIWISFDSVRADHCSFEGYARDTTPGLAAVAGRGVRFSRSIAQAISGQTKWTIVVDNKPGAGGNIGIDAVAKSPPDGYTIGLGQTSNLAINPTLYPKLPYDSLKDFTPIIAAAFGLYPANGPMRPAISAGSSLTAPSMSWK